MLLAALLLPIIPQPSQVQARPGTWRPPSTLAITLPAGNRMDRLAGAVAQFGDARLRRGAGGEIALLSPRQDSLGSEGYILDVSPAGYTLRANSDTGLYYGLQSLRQLYALRGVAQGSVPACHIVDKPRFGYRGLMLDECRHFFGGAEVRKLLDEMARLKLNTFHWHLTDDQGWRIQINRYPRLTEVGSRRRGTLIGHYRNQPAHFDTIAYGGYYTQAQIREVVAYAAARYITIIPEIEMPGHAQAAIAAYPRLGCTGSPVEPKRDWGVSNYIYNTEDSTFAFLQNVLDEVIALFPGRYVHIGGDEAAKEQWLSTPAMQAQLRLRNVADEHELQSYFIKRIERHLNARGRNMIGWDEILEGGLAPNATVMVWRGMEHAQTVLKKYANPLVLTVSQYLYLDSYQGEPANEPLAIGGNLTLDKLYNFNVQVPDATPAQTPRILGAQGNLWTEYIPTAAQVEYMLFPRLLALAEITWTPLAGKSLSDFNRRQALYRPSLMARGINVR